MQVEIKLAQARLLRICRAAWVWLCALGPGLLRASVRCAMPLLCLLVFAAFVGLVPQGLDVLRTLAERAASNAFDASVAGLLWLATATTCLGLSLWYSMRWLLGAEMAGLPLAERLGWWRCNLPRAVGAAPAALVALGFASLIDAQRADQVDRAAQAAARCFGWLALLILFTLVLRGRLLLKLLQWGLLANPAGRAPASTGQEQDLRPASLPQGQALPWLSRVIIGWGLALSFLLTAMLVLFPLGVPHLMGTAAIVGFALASINWFGSFLLSYWPLRNGLPHLAPWAMVLAGLLGWWTDNHHVQPATLDGHVAAPARPGVGEAFAQHLAGRIEPAGAPAAAKPLPVIFIASEGGGIRAAFWTAEVLNQLAAAEPGWPAQTFALSGVSGGSLGLASWLATQRAGLCPQMSYRDTGGLGWSGGTSPVGRHLGDDFLSAPVAGMLFYDLLQRFWPFAVDSFDRSRALEASWQRAHADLPGQPFARPLWQWYAGCEGRLPELLINTTVVETGQRAVLTRLADGEAASIFVNALKLDGQDLMSAGRFSSAAQSVAGLVHHSARFPALSPAGTVSYRAAAEAPLRPTVRLVDGGYYDNSGAQTLVDLIDYLCKRQREQQPPEQRQFRPIVLLVRNAPEAFDAQRRAEQLSPSGWFPESGSIVAGLYNARSAHAVTARLTLLQIMGPDLIDLAVPINSAAAKAPLGWTLSTTAQENFSQEAASLAKRLAPQLKARLAAADSACQRRVTAPVQLPPVQLSVLLPSPAASAASAP
ncbi:hypothetical protein [Roseateles sp.]|uniref:hypothetical protein n=1 Tax=Roseateles sp. TaxID=1971397 RepID=UPI00286C773A|nr:hypothetical protein [Roseateles sp.]